MARNFEIIPTRLRFLKQIYVLKRGPINIDYFATDMYFKIKQTKKNTKWFALCSIFKWQIKRKLSFRNLMNPTYFTSLKTPWCIIWRSMQCWPSQYWRDKLMRACFANRVAHSMYMTVALWTLLWCTKSYVARHKFYNECPDFDYLWDKWFHEYKPKQLDWGIGVDRQFITCVCNTFFLKMGFVWPPKPCCFLS